MSACRILGAVAAALLLASCGGNEKMSSSPPADPTLVLLEVRNLDGVAYEVWEGTLNTVTQQWSYTVVWDPTLVGPNLNFYEFPIHLPPSSATLKHYILLYSTNDVVISVSAEFIKGAVQMQLGVQIAGGGVGFLGPPIVPSPLP
jgi:hypothetical protein